MDDPLVLARIVIERCLGDEGTYILIHRTDNAEQLLGDFEALGMLEMAKIIIASNVAVEGI